VLGAAGVKGPENASYYTKLARAHDADYYIDTSNLSTEWMGRAASAFGLAGSVGRAELAELLLGHDPHGGEQHLRELRRPHSARRHPRRSGILSFPPTEVDHKGGTTMPKASKATASEAVEVEGYEGHIEHLEGGYTVAFEKYTADADMTPLFSGLPDNRCQAAHWGYVVNGKVTFKDADGEETVQTGDAYYVPPGHTPMLYAGTEVVEFSPTNELQRTLEVVSKNMEPGG
jgi:mannose-6-phosphate isomerase-like protein (cupin superfamily)